MLQEESWRLCLRNDVDKLFEMVVVVENVSFFSVGSQVTRDVIIQAITFCWMYNFIGHAVSVIGRNLKKFVLRFSLIMFKDR